MANVTLFRPLSSNAPQHENRFTWAFLVALNYDPFLRSFFRGLVEARLSSRAPEYCNPWEFAEVLSQKKSIASSTSRLVSVLLTDKVIENLQVKWSDRDAVYDGVIEYQDGLTLIIENKLSHETLWEEQLCPSRSSYGGDREDVELCSPAICLEWSEILEGILNYADSGMAPYSSRSICYDFLSFVEELHPTLSPYRTFKICGNRLPSLNRRSAQLLNALAKKLNLESRNDEYLFRPNKIAERICIWVEPDLELKVGLWPADTVSQANRFFSSVDKRTFLSLNNWKVEPNLHFSYMSRHLIWAETTTSIADYFDYFSDGNFGQMDRAKLIPLAGEWKAMGLITCEDQEEIKDQFNSTRRETLNVIPGFSVSRAWKLDDVIDLEERCELETCIIDSLATLLTSWGETLDS